MEQHLRLGHLHEGIRSFLTISPSQARHQGRQQPRSRSAEKETSSSENKRSSKYWNPVWVNRSLLISVGAFSLFLTTILIIFLILSQRDHGFQVLVDNSYIWTYGPTAILILFTTLWRQIDYSCKVLTPWSILRKHRREARENILLDYISPFEISSFCSAAVNRHWPVIVATVGFVIVKLLALASTSLFHIQPMARFEGEVATMKTIFKTGNDNSSQITPSLFEPAVVYEAYGVSAKGLPYTEGVTRRLVYESLQLPPARKGQGLTITGAVQALVPSYHCESAPFDLNFRQTNSTDLHPEVQIELAFPECTLRGGGTGDSVFALNPQAFATPPRQLSPLVQRIDCASREANLTENWQLLTLVDFRYNQTLNENNGPVELGDSVQPTSFFTSAVQGVGIACRSGYNVENVNVTYSSIDGLRPGSISVERISPGSSRRLGNLTDSDVGDLNTAALSAAAFMFGSLLTNTYVEEYPNALFKIMAALTGGTYASLLNETTMIDTAQIALNQLSLQSFKQSLVSQVKQPVPIDMSIEEKRLVVNMITASFMIVGSCCLMACAIVLVFIRPHDVTSQDPDLLSTAAGVLKQSPTLQNMLKQAVSRQEKLKYTLQCARFHRDSKESNENCEPGIHVDGKLATPFLGLESEPSDDDAPSRDRWFREMATRRPFLTISMVLPLAVIATLEAFQQLSDERSGIAAVVRPNDQIIRLLPNVLSAGAMLSIATMFNSIEFSVMILAPFSYLQGKVREPKGDLLTSYLGRAPPVVLLTAFLRQHWAVMLSTSAALMGSVLTIVVSGLFTFDTQGSQTGMQLHRLDRFDISWSESAFNDSSAAVISSLTESTGLADPAFTYQELAMPRVQLASLDLSSNQQIPLIEAQLPTLRGSLDCMALDPSTFTFTATNNPRIGSIGASFSALMPLPASCLRGGPGGNESTLSFEASFTLRSNTSYVAKLLDVHIGPYDSVLADSSGELAPHTQPDNPPHCPSLAFIYGYADTQSPAKTVASAMICTQRLEQLITNVTFTARNMSISVLRPPIPDESTAGPIPNTPNNTIDNKTYGPYRIQQHFDKTFVSTNQFRTPGRNCSFWNVMPPDALEGSSPVIDPFWQGVLCSDKDYLPIETIRDQSEDSQARVFSAVQGMYRRYIAQAIDSNMRRPLPQSSAEATALPIATLINAAPITRLVQNRTPKIILQVMLATMTLLMSIAIWMSRLWEPVVLYNPCSIAGKMALFVGSEMCDGSSEISRKVLPDGIEGLREEDMRDLWGRGGWEFRLGWWEHKSRHGKRTRRWGVDAVRKNGYSGVRPSDDDGVIVVTRRNTLGVAR